MVLAAIISVLPSAYSTLYCLMLSMGILLGFPIGFPYSSTALFLTLTNRNSYSSPLLRPSSTPRYRLAFPISVTSGVARVPLTLRFAMSTFSLSSHFSLSISFRSLLLITRWNSFLNYSSSYSCHNRLGCRISFVVSFMSLYFASHFFQASL